MLTASPDGVIVTVWVVPGASRSRVGSEHAGALRVWTAEPAEGGRANAAVAALVAARLGAPRAEVVRGHTGRRKEVLVSGITLAAASRALRSG